MPGIRGSQAQLNTSLSYPEYHFIEFDDFSELSAEDMRFLKAQGCFEIPAMPALDCFVQQYFLHVHPLLPIIDEANFWNVFNNNRDVYGQSLKISIFTFQAMLFSCCSVRNLYIRVCQALKLLYSLFPWILSMM